MQTAKISKHEVELELAKYPKSILQYYLKDVSFVESARFCGRADAIYDKIVLNCECSNSELKKAIHHEMSSILLQHYDLYVERGTFDKMYQEFVKLNGDFSYDVKIANSNDAMSKITNVKLLEYFYGVKYAQSGFENDFNVIAQFLFSNGDEIISFMNSNPEKPVSKKIRLVLDFYQKIDKGFNVSFFKNQRL